MMSEKRENNSNGSHIGVNTTLAEIPRFHRIFDAPSPTTMNGAQ